MNTNYQHALELAVRLNTALNGAGEQLRLEETPGHRLVETLAYINNTNIRHDNWKDIILAPTFGGNGSDTIPEWDEATVTIRLTGPSDQVYELEVTTRGAGRVSLNRIAVETDGKFPRNGKLLLKAKQNQRGFWVQFHPKKELSDKLFELGKFVNVMPTLAQFDEPSRDLFDLLVTALNPY